MYEELVKRLRNCTSDTVEDCAGCPYQGGYKGTYCMNGLIEEAADAIEDLTNKVMQAENDSGLYDDLPMMVLSEAKEPPKEET